MFLVKKDGSRRLKFESKMSDMEVCKKSVNALLETPSSIQLEIILKDINEISEEKLKHNERLIYDWINRQIHFPKDIDKGFIRGMLRGNKHILERTRQKLEHHLAARHIYPEIYTKRSPFAKEVAKAMDVVNIAVMPKLTPKGQRILMFGLNRFDPSEFNYQNVVKLFFMMYELLMSSDNICAGDIAIFDAAQFSTGHFAKWCGPFVRTKVTLLREAYAIRLKELHIINAPTLMIKMVSAIKPLLHSKVRNSICIHDNARNVIDIFGADYLPSNYGGNLKPIRELTTDWYQVLNDNANWFEAQEHVKITGVPRKVHNKLYLQDHLGIEGSFRRLEID